MPTPRTPGSAHLHMPVQTIGQREPCTALLSCCIRPGGGRDSCLRACSKRSWPGCAPSCPSGRCCPACGAGGPEAAACSSRGRGSGCAAADVSAAGKLESAGLAGPGPASVARLRQHRSRCVPRSLAQGLCGSMAPLSPLPAGARGSEPDGPPGGHGGGPARMLRASAMPSPRSGTSACGEGQALTAGPQQVLSPQVWVSDSSP